MACAMAIFGNDRNEVMGREPCSAQMNMGIANIRFD